LAGGCEIVVWYVADGCVDKAGEGMRKIVSVVVLVVATAQFSCGPSKKRPTEIDVSGVPQPILESFRRDQPNSIVRGVGQRDDGYRIDYFSPLRDKEWSLYNAAGDKIKSSY